MVRVAHARDFVAPVNATLGVFFGVKWGGPPHFTPKNPHSGRAEPDGDRAEPDHPNHRPPVHSKPHRTELEAVVFAVFGRAG